MRIAKPMLAVATPVGVAWALVEAGRLHWWLAVLMAVLIAVPGVGAWLVWRVVRQERKARYASATPPAVPPRGRTP